MSMFTIAAVFVVIAFIAYTVYSSIQAGHARTSELKALAPQLGLTFVGDFAPTSAANATGDPRDDFQALRAAFGDFPRFQGSMRPRLWNWMRGERDGAAVSLFDYDEGHTQRNVARIQTLAWVEDPSLRLPPFSLVPIPGRYVVPVSRVLRTVASLAGVASETAAEVPMPAHPPFDNQYLLRGRDEGALRRLFSDRVLTFFGQNPGWMVEGDGKRLLLSRLTPDEVRTYWRGAAAPSDLREMGNVASAVRDGTLRETLQASPGVPASELPLFLTAALAAGAQFRTGSEH
jgi:hypothetical protein